MLVKDPPVEVADRLWMLGTGPYPLYLFRGSRQGTIFEGGIGPMGPVLSQQLQDLGVTGDSIAQLVVTHAHPDHVMAVPLVREMCPDVRVLASEIAAKTLASEKAVGFFAKMDDALTGALIQNGLVTESQRRSALAENCIVVDEVLKDGHAVTVDDGVAFHVMETPGHSDCSLSFYEPGRNVLIISDATGYYLPEQNDWWPNYFTDYGAYIASIERLADMNADVVCLSHNGVIQGAGDVADYFQGALATTRAYHQRIVQEVQAGKSVREVAGVLGAEIHELTPLFPVDFFQKNCALLVKNSLRHEGLEIKK